MDGNIKLYDYLETNFKSVETLPGGSYRATDGVNYYYFPADFTGEDVNLQVQFPGKAGIKSESQFYLDNLNNGNIPSNTIVAVAGVCSDEYGISG